MKYYKAYPSSQLAPYIKHYWGIETSFCVNKPYLQRIIPTGLPELIFYLNYRPATTSERKLEDYAILNIQQNDYYDLVISQSLNIFSIYFYPEAINIFFNLPLNSFLNRGVVLSQLNSRIAYELQEQLLNANSFNDKVNIVENYLLKQLHKECENVDFLRMQHLMSLISKSRGSITIDKLVDESCLSRKQFERKFSKQLGISPKQYLKIIRFQSSVHEFNLTPNISLTKLALNNGYYDQAHFINEVKSFTGESPKEIFRDLKIVSDFYSI